MRHLPLTLCFILAAASAPALADPAPACAQCEQWNVTQKPFQVFGNTYYVGVKGLSSVLITSPEGHVLIDGGTPQSAAKIAASVHALGFKMEDIRLILTSHAHFDHAGGIAELQELSGALAVASPLAALAMMNGQVGPNDPQYRDATAYPPITDMRVVRDGETIEAGPLAITAHFTPGHTPGGTSWSWKSCEAGHCLNIVYADSLNPISREGFKFSASPDYPNALRDFEHSFATLAALPCDILLSAHPDASDMWGKLAKPAGKVALLDPQACRAYVTDARESLRKRLAREQAAP
ncbi:metallo-beta-lactamase class B [Oxalobacteraceae bacterium GrIS 1.11]